MDCDQVSELLDAYALGAADADEAIALEEHVADCVRCWSSLNEAQRAAASIALSTAFQRAPQSLRDRILAETERGERHRAAKLLQLARKLLPVGAGVVAVGAAASLGMAVFIQSEVSDLRDDNDQLVAEIQSTDERLTQQQQLMTVLAAPDVQQVRLEATDPTSQADAIYQWSGSAGAGALLCNNLPPLQQGQVYQVWFLTEGDSYPAGSFRSWDGIGQLTMDLDDLPDHPLAIGVSIEDAEGAEDPSEMFLFAEFQP
jgi:hypothetical protein